MDTSALVETLERTCELLAESEETVWSPLAPTDVARNLRQVVDAIGRGDAPDLFILGVEFAPTSTIQEIAMHNGWHDEYMELAAVVDRAVGKQRGHRR